ncbi:hypothetical protein FI667_g17701, partial [Globisporangium splendens]
MRRGPRLECRTVHRCIIASVRRIRAARTYAAPVPIHYGDSEQPGRRLFPQTAYSNRHSSPTAQRWRPVLSVHVGGLHDVRHRRPRSLSTTRCPTRDDKKRSALIKDLPTWSSPQFGQFCRDRAACPTPRVGGATFNLLRQGTSPLGRRPRAVFRPCPGAESFLRCVRLAIICGLHDVRTTIIPLREDGDLSPMANESTRLLAQIGERQGGSSLWARTHRVDDALIVSAFPDRLGPEEPRARLIA